MLKRLIPLNAALLLAACSSVPPAAPKPVVALSESFRSAGATSGYSVDASWWNSFGDATLTTLIERALQNNHEVAISLQRVQVARSGLTAQASRLFPTVGIQASASRSNTDLPEVVKQRQPDTRALRLGVDLAWEIDLAGGVRAARDAAAADALGAEAGVEGIRLMVASEVARQYFLWRSASDRLRIMEAMSRDQRETARLVESRRREGQASAFDVERARAEAEAFDSQLPPLRTLAGVSQTRLAVLLGENPSLPINGVGFAFEWPAMRTMAPGQPSELLRRRPDLLAAESRLAAENLRTQEARAQWWPKLFLSAIVGQQDLQLNALNLSPVGFNNVALALAAPIFNAGRIDAGIQAQSAKATEAIHAWQQAVLVAVQEVEDSLLAQKQEQQRYVALVSTLAHRHQSLQHAQGLLRAGQIDKLTLLDVQRSVLAGELAISQSHLQQQLDAVQLFKALGGGFETRSATGNVVSLVQPAIK
jgi:NodT family efflux transporter outer membrane factor (OMF) lipoprotein